MLVINASIHSFDPISKSIALTTINHVGWLTENAGRACAVASFIAIAGHFESDIVTDEW